MTRQVVVRPEVKGTDLVALLAARAEDDHRGKPDRFQSLQDLPAVDQREADVEQDDFVRTPAEGTTPAAPSTAMSTS